MRRFCAPSLFAVAIAVVAAGGLILVGSSALHEGASIPAGWQSSSSGSGDGGSGHSDTEDGGGEGVEDSTTGFVALGFLLFLLPLVSRLLCTLYEPLRPSTIYGSVLEWPD
jgi:hypothetical protein